jgi:hypothetical protein
VKLFAFDFRDRITIFLSYNSLPELNAAGISYAIKTYRWMIKIVLMEPKPVDFKYPAYHSSGYLHNAFSIYLLDLFLQLLVGLFIGFPLSNKKLTHDVPACTNRER